MFPVHGSHSPLGENPDQLLDLLEDDVLHLRLAEAEVLQRLHREPPLLVPLLTVAKNRIINIIQSI